MRRNTFKDRLIPKLCELAGSDWYPFHMPGHKRNPDFAAGFPSAYAVDITEIGGFDNLHHPEGIFLEEMRDAARMYGADRTWFLVNGSTCGIQAAIGATVRPGGKILMARNMHRSAAYTAALLGIEPVFVMPETADLFGTWENGDRISMPGSVDPDKIREALRNHPDISAVFLTSPTYEGIVSDIRSIAAAVHATGIPLIVDEAHGAHFPFGDMWPASALDLGADLVIQSLHKTLPSLTQTALLHMKSDRVDPEKVARYLRIFQSSSPSYILLASIGRCLEEMDGGGRTRMERYSGELFDFYQEMQKSLTVLRIPGRLRGVLPCFDRDLSKILVSGGPFLHGEAIAERLREVYLEPELAGRDYVLLMTSLMDREEGFRRLSESLRTIDRELQNQKRTSRHAPASEKGPRSVFWFPSHLPEAAILPGEAWNAPDEAINLELAAGRIAADLVAVYPPGVPMFLPGERITSEGIEKILENLSSGREVDGIAVDEEGKCRIRVVR